MNDNRLYETTSTDGNATAITMCADHPVYQGHFPGNPITPGVMTLKMIRECVEAIEKKPLHYATIKNCRFAAVIRPGDRLVLSTETTPNGNTITVKATLTDTDNATRLQLEAELRQNQDDGEI